MLSMITEIIETASASEVNQLLKENWVLLNCCNTQKGFIYVVGKRKLTKTKERFKKC